MMDYAEIRAIDELDELIIAVRDRPMTSNAGFGVFYGASGFGKTTAIEVMLARYGADEILVATGQEFWKSSANGMLRSLLKACSFIPPTSWPYDRLQDELVKQLQAREGVTLVIDEADKACHVKSTSRMEILREVLDALGHEASIILVGEENLPTKIQEERQFNRVAEWRQVPIIDANDIDLLFEKIDLNIERDVIYQLAKINNYRIRALITAAERVREWAAENGIKRITAEHWDQMPKIIKPEIRMGFVR